MRVLTDSELESIAGGQAAGATAATAPLYPTVRVSAVTADNPYIAFSLNQNNFGSVQTNPSECPSCNAGGSARVTYPAASGLPSAARMECLINATGEYGFGWDPHFALVGLAASAGTGAAGAKDTFIAQKDSDIPASYNMRMEGLTQDNGAYATTTITATANTPWSGLVHTISPTGVDTTTFMSLTGPQHLIWILGHETSHQHGVPGANAGQAADEARANWYGIQALNRFNTTNTWQYCTPAY